MSKKETGGPAFPAEGGSDSGLHANPGMSLRDWFAGRAVSAGWQVAMEFRPPDDSMSPEEYCAGQAYAIADAMLKERSK